MNRVRVTAWALAMLAAPGLASGFEGTMKLRTVAVERGKLAKVTGDKAPTADETLALTTDQLLASKGAEAQVRESTVYISGTKVRMDAPVEKGREGYLVIDTKKDATWFVVPSEKRYIEWSKEDAEAMGEKLAQMEKMMKERMGSLPPEQRAQVEAMLKKMKGPGAGGEAPKVTVKAIGKTRQVNGTEATGYEVSADGETLVGWVTQSQPDLNKTLMAVQERMEQMSPPAMRGRLSARSSLGEKGLPVMMQMLDDQHYRVEEVVAVEEKKVGPEMFAVPKDFAKSTGRDAMKNIPDQPLP